MTGSSDDDHPKGAKRNGDLKIPLPFDEALRAALKADPAKVPSVPKRPPTDPPEHRRH